jgi:glycolate oxidase
MAHRRGPSVLPLLEVRHDLTVELVAQHLAQLLSELSVHGRTADERRGLFGAPPPELFAALPPPVTAELRQRRDDTTIFLLLVDAAEWELPADLGLHLAVVLAGPHGVEVQRAADPTGEARPIQEDAGVLDQAGAPLLLSVIVLSGLRVDALLSTRRRELPFVVAERARDARDVIAILPVGEVGTVRAASLDEIRRRAGQDALASAPEDAGPLRQQERDVDLPSAELVFRVDERDPLAGRARHRGSFSSVFSVGGERTHLRRYPSAIEAGDRALLDDLIDTIGADRVRSEPLELSLYSRDAGTEHGEAAAVCIADSRDDVVAAVRVAARHGRPFVARGSGTGLAGGATPMGGAVVVVTTRLNRVLEVDATERVAWVEPGVLNLDLSRAVSHLGLHYAPDPSSQAACTIGGNVATNAGGPHCLASGVTSAHVLAVDVVLTDGTEARLGGLAPDTPGYDLRGCFVGSEGTMGIATRVAVRLTPDPPAVSTLLLDFSAIEHAAATVSGIIAAGVVPAALEMMDAEITRAVEDFVGAGYPRDAAAVLLVELDGLDAGVRADVEAVSRIGREHGARSVRVAADELERARLWKGRKSAFGAIARVAPDYYLHDAVVPRTQLVAVLRQVLAICNEYELTVMNVFHAGDGNLHPLIAFDAREPGIWPRVKSAGDAILRACVDAGGVLSGEHGIGLEKRDAMPLVFTADDLDAQARLRDAFDPHGLANPEKVLPRGSRCGELSSAPAGTWV